VYAVIVVLLQWFKWWHGWFVRLEYLLRRATVLCLYKHLAIWGRMAPLLTTAAYVGWRATLPLQ
jgi:hypothetical protein